MYGQLMRHGKPVRHPMNRTIRLILTCLDHSVMMQVAISLVVAGMPLLIEGFHICFRLYIALAYFSYPLQGFFHTGKILHHKFSIGNIHIRNVTLLEITSIAIISQVFRHHRFFGAVVIVQ